MGGQEGFYDFSGALGVNGTVPDVPPPFVYGFEYSPGVAESLDVLDEIARDEEIDDPLLSGIERGEQAEMENMFVSCPVGRVLKGRVEVERGFFNEYWYESQEAVERRLLRAHRVICGFEIYSICGEEEECIGYLKSNLFGTKYNLLLDGKTALEIKYTASIFRRRGPREFSVSLVNRDVNGISESMVTMKNKEPYYNVETNSYSLNFNGRVTTPSVKNFQLVHPLDPTYVTLTFGKLSRVRYILDYAYPWSGVQAFAIALAALDYKIGCD